MPDNIKVLADESFALLKENPRHPSLRWKQVGRYWSARVDQDYRALSVKSGDDFVWFWIGRHAEFDQIIRGRKK